MSTNKQAQIRFTILDRCFSNFNRNFTYENLLNEVNNVLYELGTEGVKLRQLQYDIAHMKSDAGYRIELEEDLKDGKKRLFRYKDRNFSIADHPLNQNDTEQLETTLAILSRYKNREEFSWLEEFIPRMELAFNLVASGDNGVISYQENLYLKGREFLGVLFNQILKRKVLTLAYEPYNKDTEVLNIHPYHLKQHNNRWFLICYNEKYNALSNYPLDRIKKIEETDRKFKDVDIDWVDYFDDIIGVTKPPDEETHTILLKFSENRINYVLTKPLHGSQKPDRSDEMGLTIKIEVIPNPELYQLILSFGEDVEVIEPKHLREEIKNRIKASLDNYAV